LYIVGVTENHVYRNPHFLLQPKMLEIASSLLSAEAISKWRKFIRWRPVRSEVLCASGIDNVKVSMELAFAEKKPKRSEGASCKRLLLIF